MNKTNCPFCKLLGKKDNDETFVCQMQSGSLYVHRDQCFRGRCIFILNTHIEEVTHMDMDQFSKFSDEMLIIAKSIKRIFRPALINVALLGNGIQHLHWHIIPRYENDPNWGKPPWPHGHKFLTAEEYNELSRVIYSDLGSVGNE